MIISPGTKKGAPNKVILSPILKNRVSISPFCTVIDKMDKVEIEKKKGDLAINPEASPPDGGTCFSPAETDRGTRSKTKADKIKVV